MIGGQTVQFEVLGPLRVSVDGRPVEIAGTKPRLVLLSLLMADGAVVSTDRLIEQVWGDKPPAKPHVTLRSYISNLRKLIEPDRTDGASRLLVTRSPGYQLDVDDIDVDARRFAALIAETRASQATGDTEAVLQHSSDALALWRADDLVELDAFPIDVAHLAQLRAEAMLANGQALLELGRPGEAVSTLTAQVAAHPADEALRRLQMLALYRSGRASDALTAAHDLRQHLGSQLGLDPSPPTIELEGRILANDPGLELSRAPRSAAPVAASDAEPVAAAIESPPGRDEAFLAITAEMDDGQVAVLTGEPGIGKTTLLAAAADASTSEGRRVVWGRCHDGGSSRTLWPWVSLLAQLTERLDDTTLAEVVGNRGRDLAGIVPEIGDRLGIEARSAADEFVISDAVVRLVRSVAEQTPCTLIFEDLHWSDPTSAKLLNIATSALVDAPVKVLASWRDTEPAHVEAETALAAVGRAAGRRRIELVGLDSPTIAELAEAELGERPGDDLLHVIADRTNGNPLFITELLRQADPGAAASTTIREVILQRVAQLPSGADDALSTASLCRAGFSEQMLQSPDAAANRETVEQTLSILDEAMARRLIEEDPERPNRFRFTHSLIAETLAESLSPLRRAQRHAQLGLTLQHLGAPDAELAHHFLEGARAGTAVVGAEYACQAARANRFLHDHLSSITLIERGLSALENAEGDERAISEVRIDLLIDLAQGRKHQRRPTDVHDLAVEAFELSREIGDESRMATAALAYTGNAPRSRQPVATQWLGYWNPPETALDMLQASVSKMSDDHPLRASVLLAHAAELYGPAADTERAAGFIEAGISAARHLDDAEQLAFGLLKKNSVLNRSLSIEERESTLQEVLDIAAVHDLPGLQFSANRWLAIAALDRGDRPAADAAVDAARSVAETTEDRHLNMEVESITIAMAMFDGAYDKADEALRAAFVKHSAISPGAMTRFSIQFGSVMEEKGRFDRIIDGFRDLFENYPSTGYGLPFALMLARSGQPDEAVQVLESLSEKEILAGGENELQFTVLAAMAELMWWLNDGRLADEMTAALEPAAGRIVALFDGITLQASASVGLGLVHTLAGRLDEAEACFTASLEHHRSVGARPAEVRSLAGLADVASRAGDQERAQEWLARARQCADEVGSYGWLVDEVERRFS